MPVMARRLRRTPSRIQRTASLPNTGSIPQFTIQLDNATGIRANMHRRISRNVNQQQEHTASPRSRKRGRVVPDNEEGDDNDDNDGIGYHWMCLAHKYV